ncbi:MAG: hypothetical protein E7311_00730 [Clostridiales bacterium]|nr:hypothetical protein [Clostridiales bacterium]
METLIYNEIIDTKDNIGLATRHIMDMLSEYQIDESILERIKKVVFEAEKNIKLYAQSGEIKVILEDNILKARFKDKGPGIENIGMAFVDGYTTADEEIKQKGYGLGRGFGIIQENVDSLNIASELDSGTTMDITINLK